MAFQLTLPLTWPTTYANIKYQHIIDIFGADHHGYIGRLRAFLKGLGQDPGRLKVLLVQFALLYRGKSIDVYTWR